MINSENILLGKKLTEHQGISVITGTVRNVKNLNESVFSFELWSEVSDSFSSSLRLSVFEHSDKEYMSNTMFVFKKSMDEKKFFKLLQENIIVTVVYKNFFLEETEKPINIAVSLEEPNSSYEEFIVKLLEGHSFCSVSPERFWIDRVIRVACFKRNFF